MGGEFSQLPALNQNSLRAKCWPSPALCTAATERSPRARRSACPCLPVPACLPAPLAQPGAGMLLGRSGAGAQCPPPCGVVVRMWSQPALLPCAVPRAAGSNQVLPLPEGRNGSRGWRAGRAPGCLSPSIPVLSCPRSPNLGSESCRGLSKADGAGVRVPAGDRAVPRAPPSSWSPLWVQPPHPWHGHRPAALSMSSSPGPLQTLPLAPIAPAGTKKEKVCVSLPIVPIYSPECWQDGCDLVTGLSSRLRSLSHRAALRSI